MPFSLILYGRSTAAPQLGKRSTFTAVCLFFATNLGMLVEGTRHA
jgi:hypothetical protein